MTLIDQILEFPTALAARKPGSFVATLCQNFSVADLEDALLELVSGSDYQNFVCAIDLFLFVLTYTRYIPGDHGEELANHCIDSSKVFDFMGADLLSGPSPKLAYYWYALGCLRNYVEIENPAKFVSSAMARDIPVPKELFDYVIVSEGTFPMDLWHSLHYPGSQACTMVRYNIATRSFADTLTRQGLLASMLPQAEKHTAAIQTALDWYIALNSNQDTLAGDSQEPITALDALLENYFAYAEKAMNRHQPESLSEFSKMAGGVTF